MISFLPFKTSDPAKTSTGYLATECIEPHRLAKCMSEFIYSPCVWKNGVRAEANFICARWCILDFDDGKMTLASAVNTFSKTIHVIGTTKSHQTKGVDRFRVALLFDKEINDVNTYRHNMKEMIKKYGSDEACKDAARFFWPCREIVSVSSNAICSVGVVDAPLKENKRRFENKNVKSRFSGSVPANLLSRLNTAPQQGNRNTNLFGVAKDLLDNGININDAVKIIMSSKCIEGLGTREIETTIKSAIKNAYKQKGLNYEP